MLIKFFIDGFLHISIFKIKVCIYVICVRFLKCTRNLFSIYLKCSNVLHIWSWVRQIFLTSHFSNKDDFLSFIKSDGSHLVKLINLVVITFSIWMIWRIRNYARFQDKIDLSRAISVIKDLTYLVGNPSIALMKNDMLIST